MQIMNRLLRSARFVSLMLISSACFLSHAHAQSLIQSLLLQALAAAAQAPPVDIYLAVRTDGAVGSGTAADPFDASTPERYDGLLGTYFRNTIFHYAPGTYRTNGWLFRQRQSAGPNCKHYGAGIDQTIIQLVGANNSIYDGVIFGEDFDAISDGFEVQNMTLDCNAAGNPKFVNGQGAVGAVNTQGSNILIKDVKVINFGTSQVGTECFVVIIDPGSYFSWRSFDNVQVQNCVFTSPARGNKDGMSCVVLGGATGVNVTNTAVVNSSFLNLDSDFLYSHAFYAEQCTGNTVDGCEVGTYVEPATPIVTPWLVQNNTFTNVSQGAAINFHSTGQVQELRFLNNTVTLRNILGSWSTAVDVIEPTEPLNGTLPEVVSLIIDGNNIQPLTTTPAYNPYYVGFNIQSPNLKYSIGDLQILDNTFSLATPQNAEQILISNSPTFLGSSSISGNVFSDGSAVAVNLQPVH